MSNQQSAAAPEPAAPEGTKRGSYGWLDVSFVLGVGLLAVSLVAGLTHHLVTRRAWPRTDLDHYALGDERRDRGDLVGAIREYQMTVLISPTNLVGVRRLAEAFAAAGLAEQEIEARRRVVKLAAGSPASWVALGAAQLGSNRAQEALRSFDAALARDARHAAAHAGRGDALARLGRREEALASYATAVELSPGDGALLNHVAVAHVQAGELEDGIRLLRAASRSSDDPAIHENLRRALAQREAAAGPAGNP